MQDSPYEILLQIMRGETKRLERRAFCMGLVACLAPLAVSIGDIALEESELLINPRLLSGELRVGDRVAMLTEDEEVFLILCKVAEL